MPTNDTPEFQVRVTTVLGPTSWTSVLPTDKGDYAPYLRGFLKAAKRHGIPVEIRWTGSTEPEGAEP